jgi:crossover junction endonuclease MUS81
MLEEGPNDHLIAMLEEYREKVKSRPSGERFAQSISRVTTFFVKKISRFFWAMKSIRLYPKRILSGNEAQLLKHVGPSLADQIHKFVVKIYGFAEENQVDASETKSGFEEETQAQSQKAKKKQYIPRYRSGGYAILIALGLNSSSLSMTKEEIIQVAEAYTDRSFVKQGSDFYTAWNSRKTLEKHGLISCVGRPVKIALTETGRVVAQSLLDKLGDSNPVEEAGRDSDIDENFNRQRPIDLSPASEPSQVPRTHSSRGEFSHHDWNVVLLIDNREKGVNGKDSLSIKSSLARKKIPCEVAMLSVGDMLWVAKNTRGEIKVLDYVVERKKVSDLVCSIKQVRFEEQKYRLKASGCHHVIYLVEGDLQEGEELLPGGVCIAALARTQASDGFFVLETEHMEGSALALASLSRKIAKAFKKLSEEAISNLDSFETFTGRTSKGLDQQDPRVVFGKQLQMINGVSCDRALSLLNQYASPKQLFDAIQSADYDPNLFKDVEYLSKGVPKRMGPALSNHLIQFFTEPNYESSARAQNIQDV